MKKLRVAIIGSGNIGTDLLIKTMRSPFLECTLFVGRNMDSSGMQKASSLGINVSDRSLEALVEKAKIYDLVFDATNAVAHREHWVELEKLGKKVIDLTPSRIGEMLIPAINLDSCLSKQNVNMVSCGGQASIPIVHAISQVHPDIEYVEVTSSIASKSAGLGTRLNIDEYVETTEEAIRVFSGAKRTKTILVLNPAVPCVNMQTTISAKVKEPNMELLQKSFWSMVEKMKTYVPGYEVVVPPSWETNRIVVSVRVQGLGDYLPKYAGNLDIINCAAMATAEKYAQI